MANPLVFTPNAACSNLVVLRGIVPGADYDHTWYVEDWDCTVGAKLRDANYTGNGGFVLWFADLTSGELLTTVKGTSEGSEDGGMFRFPMTPDQTERLRGRIVGRCGAGYVDATGRQLPIEEGRFYTSDWPVFDWQ